MKTPNRKYELERREVLRIKIRGANYPFSF